MVCMRVDHITCTRNGLVCFVCMMSDAIVQIVIGVFSTSLPNILRLRSGLSPSVVLHIKICLVAPLFVVVCVLLGFVPLHFPAYCLVLGGCALCFLQI